MQIKFKRLLGCEDLPLPAYATAGSAGMDLVAAEGGALVPGGRAAVRCGFALAVPEGYEAQIRPRSGLTHRHGVTVANAPGTIDADYRGEVCVILVNLGFEPFEWSRGHRIAQMVLAPIVRATLEVVDSLPATVRGMGGLGSTGR